MTVTRRTALQCLAAASLALPATLKAQGSGLSRTVRIIVPYPAGGPVDALARIIAQEIAPALGQPVIVENMPGASGAAGTKAAARAEPDGHTLVLGNNQTHATNKYLLKEPGYDPVADFSPIAGLADLQHALVVRNEIGVSDVKGLIALAKSQPGKLNYGSTGVGSASHLAMELFKVRTGTDMQHVPFRGAAPMTQEIIAGRIDLAFSTLPSVLPQIEAKTMQAFAIASPKRAPQLPNVPTLAEVGVTDADADAWLALFAPKDVPQPIQAAITRAVMDALAKDAVKANIAKQGIALNLRDPKAFAAYLDAEITKWGEVIKVAKVQPE